MSPWVSPFPSLRLSILSCKMRCAQALRLVPKPVSSHRIKKSAAFSFGSPVRCGRDTEILAPAMGPPSAPSAPICCPLILPSFHPRRCALSSPNLARHTSVYLCLSLAGGHQVSHWSTQCKVEITAYLLTRVLRAFRETRHAECLACCRAQSRFSIPVSHSCNYYHYCFKS